MSVYRGGLYRLSPEMWADSGRVIKAMLLDDAAGYVFDVEDVVVNDLVSAEATWTGTTRATVGTRSVTWDATNDRWRFLCGSLDFGTPETAHDTDGLVIYEEITDDTDSVPLTYTALAQATDGTAFTVTVDSEGAVRTAEAP